MIIIKLIRSTLFLACVFWILPSVSAATEDDDLLLTTVPSIVAATKNSTPQEPGIELVKKLNGRWKFVWGNFQDYLRFDGATARATTEQGLFLIDGHGSIFSDFSGNWCDGGMVGSYSTNFELYLILCNWGYPNTDLGSVYSFQNVTSPMVFEQFFYQPSTGELTTGIPTPGVATKLSNNYKVKTSTSANTQMAVAIAEREAALIEESNNSNFPENKKASSWIRDQVRLLSHHMDAR